MSRHGIQSAQIWRARLMVAAAAALSAGAASDAFGQARIWDGGTDADNKWSTPNNWNVDTAPQETPNTQGWRFGGATSELVTDMDKSYAFGQLQFIGTPGYVINSSTASTMNLLGFASGTVIEVGAGNPTPSTSTGTVNVPIDLVTGGTGPSNLRSINTNSGSSLFLNGALNAGSFIVRKTGAGGVTFATPNSISAGFEVTNGLVVLGDNASLGTGTISNTPNTNASNNIQFASTDGTTRTLANAFNFGGVGGFSFNPGTAGTGSGNFILSGPVTLTSGVQTLGGGAGTTTTINGQITGPGGLSKATTNTLILNGANNYAGTTNVGNGTLVVNGASVSDTTVGGGTLQGVGQARILSVFGNTANAGPEGTLSPSDNTAAGVFTAGRGDFGSGGTFLVNLNDVNAGAGVGFDQLLLNGNGGTPNSNLAVSATPGTFTIDLDGPGTGFDPSQAYSFTIVDAADVTGAAPTDAFDPSSIVVDASGFAPSLAGGSFTVVEGSDGNLNLVFTPVPEPATLGLLGMAGLGLLGRRRR